MLLRLLSFTTLVMLSAVAVPTHAAMQGSARPQNKPNLLFMMADQLRADAQGSDARFGTLRYAIPNPHLLSCSFSSSFLYPQLPADVCNSSDVVFFYFGRWEAQHAQSRQAWRRRVAFHKRVLVNANVHTCKSSHPNRTISMESRDARVWQCGTSISI